jgi:hypothetical protein
MMTRRSKEPQAKPVSRKPSSTPTKTGHHAPKDTKGAEPKGSPTSDRSKTETAVTQTDDE